MSLRIAITQRVEDYPDIGERRDCLDQAWFKLIESYGHISIPVPNTLSNIEGWVKDLKIDGIILTGGNDLLDVEGGTNFAPERDKTEKHLIDISARDALPLLGVCRGMQLLCNYYKSELDKVKGHVAITHKLCRTKLPLRFFQFEQDIHVNSYHNYAIRNENLSNTLEPIFKDSNGYIEAIQHKTLPQFGIMWHPERKEAPEEFDQLLFKSFFQKN